MKNTNMQNCKISAIDIPDYPFLEEFLYHAIYLAEGETPPPREIVVEDKEIYKYIKDFGNKDDCGVVAKIDDKIIGMAWTRIIGAYGYLDDATPELAIAVLDEYRCYGIGTKLMEALFNELIKKGYKRTSLSVQKGNPATRFYIRLGYTITEEKLDHAGHEDYIMVKQL
ncbi:MAG: GNAT family N-acetyltransferase [Firmicutes bacterium]|nr:GNAT family N-acetyltransferase [Bacillota bacterium]